MRLIPGDYPFLRALMIHRYLLSRQVTKVVGRSSAVCRRRLNALIDGKYAFKLEGRSVSEYAAFGLGPRGFEAMAVELGVGVRELPFSPKLNRKAGLFFAHTVLTNDILLSYQLGAKDPESPIVVEECVPEWELASPHTLVHHERFRLSERFEVDGRSLCHRPDALILLSSRSSPDIRVAAFAEADRATESMRRIRGKLASYYAYWQRRRFEAAFGARAMRILFVLDAVHGMVRVQSMKRALAHFVEQRGTTEAELFAQCFRFCLSSDLSEKTVFTAPIWSTLTEERRLFLQPPRNEVADEPSRAVGE